MPLRRAFQKSARQIPGRFVPGARASLAVLQRRAALTTAVLLILWIWSSAAIAPLDNALSATRMKLLQRAPSGSLAVVQIDAPSLRATQVWPWPRENYARAIKNLRAAGAKLIAFDVDFSAGSSASGDAAIRAALDADPGDIILPTFVQSDERYENAPLAGIADNAVLGSVNIGPDADGKVRRYPRGFHHGVHYHPTIAAVLANAAYGADDVFLIDFGIQLDKINRLSFDDVLNNRFDPRLVRGRQILIGATTLELGDQYPTPLARLTPGVFLHALAFESLVEGRALLQPNPLLVLAAGLAALFLLWPRRRPVDVAALIVRHAAVFAGVVLVPVAVQAALPISLDTGIIIAAQVMCVVVGVQRELSRRSTEIVRQREAHLAHIALHDPETGLPNRRALLRRLVEISHQPDIRSVAVLALGIDRFATLRGAIGYANSNNLVSEFAARLASSGECDVFHLSTSILGVVVTAQDETDITTASETRLAQLDGRIRVAGQDINVIFRTGAAALSNASAANLEGLLERATIALDHARIANRQFARYESTQAVDPKLQLALVSDVGRGLERGEFALVYQPKVSARNGRVTGAEALMRWSHPEFGDLPPDHFIRIAEETGSVDLLTRWALKRVIEDQAELNRRGFTLTLSLNLSARSLSDARFCEDAVKMISASGARLCLEVTETALIESPTLAMSAIAAFRDAGVAISIDDYGSGLSSLSYLKQISADELKLDRGLVHEVTTNARDRLILKSTVDLAHGLGMTVVAEGVEDAASCAILARMGCDTLQGYHVGRPSSLEALEAACLQAASPGLRTSGRPQSA